MTIPSSAEFQLGDKLNMWYSGYNFVLLAFATAFTEGFYFFKD